MKSRRTTDARSDAAPLPALPTPAPTAAATMGDVTERYDNHGEIARGGMGAILKVVDRTLHRTLAMKVLEPADGQKDHARSALFLEEAQITSQLDHPNICPIQEYGRDQSDVNYFTMKLVRGRTLADVVHDKAYDPSNPQCVREALNVVVRVCDALAFAHARGVLHRDLKPENIMVGDFGQVYLMDWGVAHLLPIDDRIKDPVRVSRTGPSVTDGAIVGTLMYMPPEQARGAAIDVRTDVFGLGAILYEVLTQVPLYYAQGVGDLVLLAQGAGWRPPQEMVGPDQPLPAALCQICERAIAPDPAERYPDVPALKAALEEFLVGGMSFPTQVFVAGSCIVNEGESGETAYIVQRGHCRIFKLINGEQVALADLGPGDVFGETAVFAETPRTATIQALTEVTVQVVNQDVFAKDLGMAAAMGAFVKALARRFVSTDKALHAARHTIILEQQKTAAAQMEADDARQEAAAARAGVIAPHAPRFVEVPLPLPAASVAPPPAPASSSSSPLSSSLPSSLPLSVMPGPVRYRWRHPRGRCRGSRGASA